MARCEVCGNDYDKAFTININNDSHTFDCFECAIQKLAPECVNCGTKIIGHGVEDKGKIFCSEHCLKETASIGVKGIT